METTPTLKTVIHEISNIKIILFDLNDLYLYLRNKDEEYSIWKNNKIRFLKEGEDFIVVDKKCLITLRKAKLICMGNKTEEGKNAFNFFERKIQNPEINLVIPSQKETEISQKEPESSFKIQKKEEEEAEEINTKVLPKFSYKKEIKEFGFITPSKKPQPTSQEEIDNFKLNHLNFNSQNKRFKKLHLNVQNILSIDGNSTLILVPKKVCIRLQVVVGSKFWIDSKYVKENLYKGKGFFYFLTIFENSSIRLFKENVTFSRKISGLNMINLWDS
jgi:hypothetical protein